MRTYSAKFRQLPGTTVLGLVAALVTHAVLFGGEHVWGGAYHSALLELTLAALTSLTGAAAAFLWSGARCAADGTVLASRLRAMMPGWAAIAASGAGWFALGERLESAHAGVPFVAIAVMLALVAWMLRRFASVGLRALAGIVFAIARGLQREQGTAWRPSTTPLRRFAQDDSELWRRRFTRPPPVTANA